MGPRGGSKQKIHIQCIVKLVNYTYKLTRGKELMVYYYLNV